MYAKFEKIINFFVGLLILFFVFKILFNSGITDPLFAPAVEDGNLGSTGFAIWTALAETFLSVVVSIGAYAIFWLLRGGKYLMNFFIEGNGDDQPIMPVSNQRTMPTANDSNISSEMYGDLSRLLLNAAAEGDKRMTIVLAEKIAGKPYLTEGTEATSPLVPGK